MRYAFAGLLAFASSLVTVSSLEARPEQRVTQVTATDVYINIGSGSGIQPGDEVTISVGANGLEVTIVEVWGAGARAKLPKDARFPRVGTPVVAPTRPVVPVVRQAPKALKAPEAQAVMAQRWNGVSRARPSLRPVAVSDAPSMVIRQQPRLQGYLRADYLGLINLGGSSQQHYHLMAFGSGLDVPMLFVQGLSYAHRLRVRVDAARDLSQRRFRDSRPRLLVTRARLGLDVGRFSARVGRLLSAPSALGVLTDGASVQYRLTDALTLGAFGGGTPRPQDLDPNFDSLQFGAQARLRLAAGPGRDTPWRLSADFAFLGSTWEGELDRTATTAQLVFETRSLSLFASGVVDLFLGEHPAENTIDLTSAALAARFRATSWLSVGARWSRYRFVQSREFTAIYPGAYVTADAVQTMRANVQFSLPAGFMADVEGGWDQFGQTGQAGWASASVRRFSLFAAADHAVVSAQVVRGGFLAGVGGRLAYLVPVTDWLTGSASYRLSLDRGNFDNQTLRQFASLGVEANFGRHVLLSADGTVQASGQERLLSLFSSVAWVF